MITTEEILRFDILKLLINSGVHGHDTLKQAIPLLEWILGTNCSQPCSTDDKE